ncbi:hypothetical protein M433DRAFT_131136 [Acidomyces richmondensis BFW]|nr:MAG: hypothetical protein FE78DRAFT_152775 [Acidomyces sp. 'richmondensis']KYG49613.1 hypothetical protein M433DRAFT_131136 [Acidomyces richmondensis BFW]
MRGQLIVLEGLDRSGKSTQTQHLATRLRASGRPVEILRFPDRTTAIGQLINTYLHPTHCTEKMEEGENLEPHAIHLLFTANRWELSPRIRSLVECGTTVVIDRYYYSGCVYTAAAHPNTMGMDLAWCRQAEVGLPRPDVWVYLDIGAEGTMREGFGEERYERVEVQERVRCLYEELRRRGKEEAEDCVVVDGRGTVEEVGERVWEAVCQRERHGDLRNVGAW